MIVAGNWKMNLNINEAIELSNELLKPKEVFVEEKIIIFPAFLIIREIIIPYNNNITKDPKKPNSSVNKVNIKSVCFSGK